MTTAPVLLIQELVKVEWIHSPIPNGTELKLTQESDAVAMIPISYIDSASIYWPLKSISFVEITGIVEPWE